MTPDQQKAQEAAKWFQLLADEKAIEINASGCKWRLVTDLDLLLTAVVLNWPIRLKPEPVAPRGCWMTWYPKRIEAQKYGGAYINIDEAELGASPMEGESYVILHMREVMPGEGKV